MRREGRDSGEGVRDGRESVTTQLSVSVWCGQGLPCHSFLHSFALPAPTAFFTQQRMSACLSFLMPHPPLPCTHTHTLNNHNNHNRCCGLERAPAAVDAAVVAICYLAASPALQTTLLECGALSALIPLLLQYDVTLSPEAAARLQLPFTTTAVAGSTAAGARAVQQQQQQQQQGFAAAADLGLSPEVGGLRLLDAALVRPNMQEARSQHALLAAQALARLAGGVLRCWFLEKCEGECGVSRNE